MSIYYFLQRKCFGNALNMYHRRCSLTYEVLSVIANLSRHPYSLACNALMSLRSTALRCCGNLPEGTPHPPPTGYFCTRGERRVHKIRICRSIALFNDSVLSQIRGPQKILCAFGEKEHTSKRVSIIACNNVISKVQCATGTDTKH